ncbi:MAG: cytochrome c [candidate division KSB1 bacterium]|nr:cytochrome c [candidate division KSB1 bacterium]
MTVLGRVGLVVLFAPLLLPVPTLADPASDYVLHCQGCHGVNGEGSVDGAPPFRGHLRRFARTELGRAYLLGVPGVAHTELDDARLAALLNWLLWKFDPDGSDVRQFTPEEVRAGRQRPLLSVPVARRQVLDEQ